MRPVLLATTFLLAATPAWAGESTPREYKGRGTQNLEQRNLTAAELERYAAPYLPAVKHCYLAHGGMAASATGQLALELIVHRDGGVVEIEVDAPGVTGKRLAKLSRCIRSYATRWQFPVRRDFTTAVLPYYFVRLAVPGAGPQPSCWNPRGCPKHKR